jgi:uncharacterized SAM-binding protein YcdF (DUF218 family)
LAFVLLAVTALLLLLGIFHRSILTTLASLWIVDSSDFARVELVIIPGGNFDTRPFGAAELFHEGRCDKIAVFKTELAPTVEMGLVPSDHAVNLAVLKKLEVPDASIITLGDGVTSTWDEVAATRVWCETNRPRSIAIVTEIFPSRRIRYAYEKGLRDLPLEIHVVALPAQGYTAADWWRSEKGLIAFQNEVVKWVYYRVR